jgi:hypothetical protein
MTQIPLIIAGAAILAIMNIVFLLRLALLAKDKKLLSEQLTQTTVALEQARQSLEHCQAQKTGASAFAEDLNNAELTTQFQKPRLDSQFQANAAAAAPTRYGFIHSLLEREMPLQEIASILAISLQEARQLATLSRLAKPRE